MDPVIVYARRLQAGEIPPADIPSNAAPLYVNSEGKLLVSVEGVTINLPGGGVNMLDPIGPAGAIQVESVPGSPVQVAFVTAPDVKISQPLGAAGGVKVEPAATVVFPVSFNTPQQVTFPSAQPVAFNTPQQVTFPATQPVNMVSPVGAGGGVRIENNPGERLKVGFGPNIPEFTLAPGITDPFSRLRISEALTLFDSKFYGDKRPELWDERLVGGATSVAIANAAEIRHRPGVARRRHRNFCGGLQPQAVHRASVSPREQDRGCLHAQSGSTGSLLQGEYRANFRFYFPAADLLHSDQRRRLSAGGGIARLQHWYHA